MRLVFFALAANAVILSGCGGRDSGKDTIIRQDRCNQECGFLAQVASVEPVQSYRGEFVATGPHDSYVVSLERISHLTGTVPGVTNDRAAYSIHSPLRTFAAPADEVVGKWYEFTIEPGPAKGYWRLKARSTTVSGRD